MEVKYAKFYRLREEWGEFSNFFRRPIELDAKVWPSSEHYYQANKGLDEETIELIRALKTPREAADTGRIIPMRPDWETPATGPDVPITRLMSVKFVKDMVMWRALVAKFTQHDDLKKLLLSTDDALIVEHTVNDRYWGDNGDGTGFNHLGRQLMDLREVLGGKPSPIVIQLGKLKEAHSTPWAEFETWRAAI